MTCHDIDAFRTLLPGEQRESTLPRALVKRVLTGLQRAAAIVCDSEATRSELLANALVPADRTSVVPIAVHPACTVAPDLDADATAAVLTGRTGPADLLHVGSTIPRKRIEMLLEIMARVAEKRPDVKLWRVGGPFTEAQRARACQLGVAHSIMVLPFVTRPVLAALYRRAALVLLPSEREGFGLPVIEAMACGTPIVCSDSARAARSWWRRGRGTAIRTTPPNGRPGSSRFSPNGISSRPVGCAPGGGHRTRL